MLIDNFLSVISEISRSQAKLVFPAVTSYHTQGNLTEHIVIFINVDICKIRCKGLISVFYMLVLPGGSKRTLTSLLFSNV